MTITTPIRFVPNPDQETSFLYFDEVSAPKQCYMRGGICWPILDEWQKAGEQYYGFALMIGYNVNTKTYTVYEERFFSTIEPVLGDDGLVLFKGFAEFSMLCWKHYGADQYYYHQPDNIHRRFEGQILNLDMLQPKPYFPEIRWDDVHHPMQILAELRDRKRLLWRDNSAIPQQMQYYLEGAGPRHTVPVPLHALLCALTGLITMPWRRNDDVNNDIEIVLANR